MQVTINVPEEVAAAAQAQGVSVEAYIEEMVVRNARKPREVSVARLMNDLQGFDPVPIRGEELSATILRDRR